MEARLDSTKSAGADAREQSFLTQADAERFEAIVEQLRALALGNPNAILLNTYQNLEEFRLQLQGE